MFEIKQEGLSFIIPNWNHRFYLSRSVSSCIKAVNILQKNGVSSEIIVIDDFSRDGSQRFLATIMSRYPEIDFRIIMNKKNIGLPSVRNLGLEKCQYKYACMLDADNAICPDNILTFYNAAVSKSAALTYGNVITMEKGKAVTISNFDLVLPGLFTKNYIDALSIVSVDTVLNLGGYSTSENVKGVEDWELISHLFSEGCTIVFIPVLFAYYYREVKSMITDGFQKNIERMFYQRRQPLSLVNDAHYMYHPALGTIIK